MAVRTGSPEGYERKLIAGWSRTDLVGNRMGSLFWSRSLGRSLRAAALGDYTQDVFVGLRLGGFTILRGLLSNRRLSRWECI